jgi:dienelactone hydrolase
VGRQARDFARRGWAAVAVSRRGYGESDGPFVEDAGRCDARDYLRAGRESGEDLRGAIGWLAAQAWADPKQVLLVGVSAGGFASTALAAEPPPGVVGIVSFAGGRGSRAANDVCQPERLVAAFGTFGRTARAPALWIYAENDLFFGPDLARQMHAAYVAGGAPAEFVMEPPFGEDGHSLYAGAQNRWWPLVDGFLRRHSLPTWSPATLTLNGAGAGNGRLKEAFERYLAGPGEKAMAITETGAFGWATGRSTTGQARADALDFCRRNSNAECRLRFVNLAPAP